MEEQVKPKPLYFVPCIVCGEEYRYLAMIACLWCEEPICTKCYRQDGFCSDECYDAYADEKNDDEVWEGPDEPNDWYP